MARFFKLLDEESVWIDLDHICLLKAEEKPEGVRLLLLMTNSESFVQRIDWKRWCYLKEHFFVEEGIGIGE